MTREERLEYCGVCKNRGFDPKQGIVCGLTQEAPTFEGHCIDYTEDVKEKENNTKWKSSLKSETKKSVNKGRIALFIIAGLYVLAGFVEGFVTNGGVLIAGIIDWIVAAMFVGVGIWSYYRPFLAFIVGLSLYAFLVLLIAYFDPSTLWRGIIWKVLIVTYLIYGIQSARGIQRAKKIADEDILDQI